LIKKMAGVKRILYVDGTGEMSGAEVSLLGLVTNLDRGRYQPIVMLPWRGRFAQRLEANGIKVTTKKIQPLSYHINPILVLHDALAMIPFIVSLWRYIVKNGICLVHVNAFNIAIPCTLAAKLAGVPVVWHVRDIPKSERKRKVFSALALTLADKVIAISRAVHGGFTRSRKETAKVVVIYNAIDLKWLEGSDGARIRAKLGISDTTYLIGNIGQWVPWKGQDLFMRAAAIVVEHFPNVKFLLVGYEIPVTWRVPKHYLDYGSYVHQLVKELNLQDKVFFSSFQEDIFSIYLALDIYAHAATLPEPFGRVLIESLACGTPVVAPNHGGIPEIVEHGRTGLLFPPGDANALAAALIELLQNEQERANIAKAGYERVRRIFTIEKHVEKVQRIYDSLLEYIPPTLSNKGC